MNREAIKRHDIWNRLEILSDSELDFVMSMLEFLRFKQKSSANESNLCDNVIKLEGILAGVGIDSDDLKAIRDSHYKHLEEEIEDA